MAAAAEMDDVLIEQAGDDGDVDLPALIDDAGERLGGERAVPTPPVTDADGFRPVARKRRRPEPVERMDVERALSTSTAPSRKRAKTDRTEVRRVSVPRNRYGPLKEHWMRIFSPVVEHLHLQIRFNLRNRQVELRNSGNTDDIGNLQKAADFVTAFVLGFDIDDALALVRLDDLFVESFEINDVKPLQGEHLSRAIGRIAGKDGRTKLTIENATKTRIVLADSKIHLLGTFGNIRLARNALCSLILGAPPSKVYGNLRSSASRAAERF